MKTYSIRTFGCQMNKHDAERISGLLASQGMRRVDDADSSDVVVFMTCCVREAADERLRGQVASLKAIKTSGRPELLIAVGGCIGQRDGEKLLELLPHVDVVFGTHNLGRLPEMLDAAAAKHRPQVEVLAEGTDFPSDLPSEREHPWHAWVPITLGCDNFCTYCVVPYVRGRERSRPLEQVTDEVQHLVDDGVVEVTLLGQNVNSYGRDLYGEPRFADVLKAVSATGVKRIRFATSHPKDLSAATIRAMADLDPVMPYLHLPLQSGSDAVLERMNRKYTSGDYKALVGRIRDAIPEIALSTDIIVGFPGESDVDFEATLEVVAGIGYSQAFTFLYSPREGTPAATMAGPVDRQTAQRRFDRLVDEVQASALRTSQAYLGTVQQVLFEGVSKRDPRMLTGRTPANKVVHAPLPHAARPSDFAGRLCDIAIDDAQTWFLSGSFTDA
jgi:tRNA-2-methylthio-N6-dimethylallyladenosine synthase